MVAVNKWKQKLICTECIVFNSFIIHLKFMDFILKIFVSSNTKQLLTQPPTNKRRMLVAKKKHAAACSINVSSTHSCTYTYIHRHLSTHTRPNAENELYSLFIKKILCKWMDVFTHYRYLKNATIYKSQRIYSKINQN